MPLWLIAFNATKTLSHEVAQIVYESCLDEVEKFRSSHCYIINKRMFYQGVGGQQSAVIDKDVKDEFSKTWADWTGDDSEDDYEDEEYYEDGDHYDQE